MLKHSLKKYSLKKNQEINFIVIICLWIGFILGAITCFLQNKLYIFYIFVITVFSYTLLNTILYKIKPFSKIIKYTGLWGIILLIYMVCYLEKGNLNCYFYIYAAICATIMYTSIRYTILSIIYVNVTALILFIFFKQHFFPTLNTAQYLDIIVTTLIMCIIFFFQNKITRDIFKEQLTLFEKSIIDKLTGAYNRTHYEEVFSYLIEQSNLTNSKMSVLMFDIDKFKIVNDTYGHDIGDFVLKTVIERIQKLLRNNDKTFRIGGEEFIIIAHETDINGAKCLAEKLRKSIEEEPINNINITISIGITEKIYGDTKKSIFLRADKALYKAKHSGRNCYCVF
jgi:diguanylate cyclase (GGDEF)-like protein